MGRDRTKLPITRPDAAYEVGYGKPPSDSRFKPGQSGNPKGRPRGAKNKRPALNEERLKGIILDEAYRDITVRDGERNVTVPMARAIIRALAVNAAKGNHRAQQMFADLLSTTEAQNKAQADELLKTAIDYKLGWEEELRRREAQGITHLPPPRPPPDQVKIDMKAGTARIQGPVTTEDVAELALWEQRRDGWVDELAWLHAQLAKDPPPEERARLEEDLRQGAKTLAIITRLLELTGY